METRQSNPWIQYGSAQNLLNRELAWNRYGIGVGKYGIDFLDLRGDELVLDVGSGTGSDVVVISHFLNSGGRVCQVPIF